MNERRNGRSDRSADFRVLARWFADNAGDDAAHPLWRAAFALNPARHFRPQSGAGDGHLHLPVTTPYAAAPPVAIHLRLRAHGEVTRAGRRHVRVNATPNARCLPRISPRNGSRSAPLARRWQPVDPCVCPTSVRSIRKRPAYSWRSSSRRWSHKCGADAPVERQSADDLLRIRLEPREDGSMARIETDFGLFSRT